MASKQLQIVMKLRDEATKKITTLQGKMRNFARQVKQHWMAAAAAIAAVAVAMRKLSQVITSSIAYALQMDKIAKQTAMTTQEFAKLAYAAEQEHTNMESLTKILPILAKYMEYSRQGMVTYKREFDKMGVTVTNASGKLKSTYQILLEMSDYYSTATNKTEALAIAATLLGRRGAELIPLLKLGKERIKELGKEAERLGIVLSPELAAKMKIFDDKMTTVKAGMKGTALTITEILLPALNRLANEMTRVAFNVENNKVALKAFINVALGIQEIAHTAQIPWGTLGFSVRKELKDIAKEGEITAKSLSFITFGGVGESGLEQIRKRAKAAADAMQPAKENMMTVLGDLEEKNKKTFFTMARDMHKSFNMMEEAGKRTFHMLSDSFGTIFLETFKGQLRTAQDYFVAFGNAVLKGLSDIMGQWVAMQIIMGGASLFAGGAAKVPQGQSGTTMSSNPAGHGGLFHAPPHQLGTPYIPQTGLYTLHKGETVIPAHRTEAAGGGGDSQNVTYVINAVDAASFAEMLYRNKASIHQITQEGLRYNAPLRNSIKGI